MSISATSEEGAVLDVDDRVLGEPDGAGAVGGLVARHELGSLGGQQLHRVVGHRVDVVVAGFAVEERLQFGELVRVLGRQVGA
jgi:hypothetical protein